MSKPSRRASRADDRATVRPDAAGGTAPSARPPGTRAGRRERPRRGYARRSFLDRYRGVILAAAGIAAIAVVGGFVVMGATAKTYTCSTIWDPAPSASPSPAASPALGYVQPDMGNSHNVSQPQTYAYCPPASGSHINSPPNGPIPARVYGPDDFAVPPGWIHNLEHGALVLLYKCPGPGCDADQARLRQLFQTFPKSPVCSFPPGQVNPVIARFDEMNWPYAAIVWDRVLPLDTLDTARILAFYNTYAERTNPERLCPLPTPTPGPSSSTAPSGSAAPSGSGAASGSPAASASPQPSASAS